MTNLPIYSQNFVTLNQKLAFLTDKNPNIPAFNRPSSAACPFASIVLTKIPKAPFGESRPPTIVNPKDFFPGPFSSITVWKVQIVERGLRGRVQKFVVSAWGLEGNGDSLFLVVEATTRRKTLL